MWLKNRIVQVALLVTAVSLMAFVISVVVNLLWLNGCSGPYPVSGPCSNRTIDILTNDVMSISYLMLIPSLGIIIFAMIKKPRPIKWFMLTSWVLVAGSSLVDWYASSQSSYTDDPAFIGYGPWYSATNVAYYSAWVLLIGLGSLILGGLILVASKFKKG